jgi:hypothetical protein
MSLANTPAVLYPLFALAALTACVQLLIPIVRVRSGLRGEVRPHDFALGEAPSVPPRVSIPNRNYMNLLEFPVLLYVACILAYIATPVTQFMVSLAWVFVALRGVHSAIHLTYNRVSHRALVFGASNVVLVLLWIQVALRLSPGTAA